jgi:CxxC motif-containing protein (DUF1111 family)
MKPHPPQTLVLFSVLTLAATLASARAQTQTIELEPQVRAIRRQVKPRAIPPPQPNAVQLGDPLPGLTDAQRADFAGGLDEFVHVEDAAGGLGPIFNNVSCVACHSSGAPGGASAVTVTRFGHMANGVFDPLDDLGGTLLQQNAIALDVQEVIPPEANVAVHRQSTPLFGLGLIEAISDLDIQRGALHRVVDGIRGKVSMISDAGTGAMRVGRFGWKAQQASVLTFAGDAYLNEMGITSRIFPTENAPNGDTARLALYDNFLDPEDQIDPATGKSDIDAAADFMRFLAPPAMLPQTANTVAGRAIFDRINCEVCHTPVFVTGPNSVAALSQKPVPLYSDLLLHDMGLLGDGVAQSAAGPREMRTAPLWGLRVSGPYLHDGRAATVDEAIRHHDGEAKISRDRYQRLPAKQQQQLLEFLGTL